MFEYFAVKILSSHQEVTRFSPRKRRTKLSENKDGTKKTESVTCCQDSSFLQLYDFFPLWTSTLLGWVLSGLWDSAQTTQTVRRAFRRLGMEHQTQILFLLFFLLMPIRASTKHLTAICIKRLLRRKRGVFFPSSPSIGKFMITAWSQNFARRKISSGPETRERKKISSTYSSLQRNLQCQSLELKNVVQVPNKSVHRYCFYYRIYLSFVLKTKKS